MGQSLRADEPSPEVKKRIEEIAKKIAEHEAEIAKLKAELAKLNPTSKPRKIPALNFETMAVGVSGPLKSGDLTAIVICKEVIDANTFRAKLIYSRVNQLEVIIIAPTKGLVDDIEVKDLFATEFQVIETKKVGGKTYFVLQP